ncbi:MAG: GspE/PulE family protein [Phycisphaerae bacterium]
MTEKLFSTYDIAQLMQASPGEVCAWMQQGILPYMRLPNGPIRISQRGLGLFLKSRGLENSGLLETALSQDYVPVEPESPAAAGRTQTRSHIDTAVKAARRINPPVDLSDDEDFLFEIPAPAQPADELDFRSEAELAADSVDQGPAPSQQAAEAAEIEPPQPEAVESSVQDDPAPAAPAQGPGRQVDPAEQVAEALLVEAVQRRASHIHLEPDWEGLTLRLRIDSVLQTIDTFARGLPEAMGPAVVENLRQLAGLDDAPPNKPQSGSFTFAVDQRDVECVLSTWPTRKGTRVTIQVIDTNKPVVSFDNLGLARQEAALLTSLMAEPCGLILVAGLPRSGRYTTLNAMVQRLNSPGRNIITIEKTPEYDQPGVSQSSMTAELDIELADALRAVARQDADVIMVQELTDPPAAKEAVNMALQGRLVLAGMYAESGPDAIGSLLEMGLDSWSLSKALLAVLAPWTVRRLCQHCRKIIVPDDTLLRTLGLSRSDLTFPVFGPTGCPHCHHIGYDGRTGCFSLIENDRVLGATIRHGGDVAEIERTALQNGTHSLAEAAMEKVADGVTSLAEIARVLPHQLFVRSRN